jgi:hypothetical protein
MGPAEAGGMRPAMPDPAPSRPCASSGRHQDHDRPEFRPTVRVAPCDSSHGEGNPSGARTISRCFFAHELPLRFFSCPWAPGRQPPERPDPRGARSRLLPEGAPPSGHRDPPVMGGTAGASLRTARVFQALAYRPGRDELPFLPPPPREVRRRGEGLEVGRAGRDNCCSAQCDVRAASRLRRSPWMRIMEMQSGWSSAWRLPAIPLRPR